MYTGERHLWVNLTNIFLTIGNGGNLAQARWAVVAEWLRRLTRNQIPSGSVGSNPTDCEILF